MPTFKIPVDLYPNTIDHFITRFNTQELTPIYTEDMLNCCPDVKAQLLTDGSINVEQDSIQYEKVSVIGFSVVKGFYEIECQATRL